MDNRFGIKDFFLFLLLTVAIVLLVVAMFQFDRQWEDVQQTQRLLESQTSDLTQIRRLLQEGIRVQGVVPSSTTAPSAGGGDHAGLEERFRRVREAQAMPGYARGDWLVDTFGVVPDRLTPLISTDAYSSEVQGNVLESLAVRDPETLEWVPNLAKSWTISEDGLTIDFVLQRGLTFSDGAPLTVDDVVFSFGLMMNEQIEAPRVRAYYAKVKSVEKTGEDTVRFTFREPYFQAFLLAGGMEVLPKHFYEKVSPTEFNRSTGLLLGSGPYRLADPTGWRPEPGKPVELVRNERYWGEPPPFDRLVWRVIENDAARLTTFRNGEIDVFSAQPEQYVSLSKDPEVLKTNKNYDYQPVTSAYSFVAWNQKRNGQPTIFADPRVRQAMTMLTDRNRIIQDLYYGYGTPVSGPFSPLSPQSNPDVKPWPYDPGKARELLREAGFEDRNNDGVLEDSGGRQLRFKLSYNATRELTKRMVLLIKDTFAKAGVVVDADPTEWSVLLQRMDNRDFDAVTLGWSGVIESDPFQIFHSSQIAGTGDNFIQYANPELDKLIDEARITVDEDKRMKMWNEVHRILHEDQPYTFLVAPASLVFIDDRIMNVQRIKLGLNPLYEWYVPADQRRWSK